MSSSTTQRHGALRHHLPPAEAARPADEAWTAARIARYASAAGVAPVVPITSPAELTSRTGRPVSARTHGQADYGRLPALVYVDPVKCGSRGAAELVIAHEVGHVRWPSYTHRTVFFHRVQQLLDAAATF